MVYLNNKSAALSCAMRDVTSSAYKARERAGASSASQAAARHTFPLTYRLGRGNTYMCRALSVSHAYVHMYTRRSIHNIQHASLNFRLLFLLFYINFSAFLFLINLALHRLLVNISAIFFFSFYFYNIDNTFFVVLVYIMTLYFNVLRVFC